MAQIRGASVKEKSRKASSKSGFTAFAGRRSTPNNHRRIMPAPEIPNLKSLLANRRGGQQRGRGRGLIVGGAKHGSSDAAKDLVVQNTDQDAATSRLSCIELGYLEDTFAKAFATQPTIRRLPLLNRGKLIEHG